MNNLSIHPRNWPEAARSGFGFGSAKSNTCKPEKAPASKGIRRRRAWLDARMKQYNSMSVAKQQASRKPGSMRG